MQVLLFGKARFMKGPTRLCNTFTQDLESSRDGTWQMSCSPVVVVNPKILAFCARLYSDRLKIDRLGFKKAAFFFSLLRMIVRGARFRTCLPFRLCGQYTKYRKSATA